MKTCPTCQEDYNPEAQFYSAGDNEVCGSCHDDWEDEQKEKAEERASLAGLEVPDDVDDTCAVEGAFDVNKAIASATPEQLARLLAITDEIETVEAANTQMRIDNARREGELAAMDRFQGMLKAGGM